MIYLLNFWRCWKKDHVWKFDDWSLTGEWISCERCGLIDEYIPGAHKVENYKSRASHLAEAHKKYRGGVPTAGFRLMCSNHKIDLETKEIGEAMTLSCPKCTIENKPTEVISKNIVL